MRMISSKYIAMLALLYNIIKRILIDDIHFYDYRKYNTPRHLSMRIAIFHRARDYSFAPYTLAAAFLSVGCGHMLTYPHFTPAACYRFTAAKYSTIPLFCFHSREIPLITLPVIEDRALMQRCATWSSRPGCAQQKQLKAGVAICFAF